MRFIFVSVPTFELWDWTNPDKVGIGGSETSHIEMARRLVLRGHEVISYSPSPVEEDRVTPEGVVWQRCDKIDASLKGIWVIYRAPEIVDCIPDEGNEKWLICQDVDYPLLSAKRVDAFDKIFALCNEHKTYLETQHENAKGKVVVSSNGIKTELIEQVLLDPPKRIPTRLLYASSPDRGLENLLPIFERAKEIIPDLELHVAYGFDNIEKVEAKYQSLKLKGERLRKALTAPGIVHHGRLPQPELLKLWASCGIWCHPSLFAETSCITCMDAQALGAIPLTIPTWAIAENVQHGVFIDGDPADPLTRARFVLELVRLASDPIQQDGIREAMMPWAFEHFDWEKFVDQWEVLAGCEVSVSEAVAC